MNKYKVKGLYTISFEMEVEAKDEDEAIENAYNDCDIQTEWNGNSVFSYYNNCTLEADGEPRDIEVVELIDSDEDEYDIEEEEE